MNVKLSVSQDEAAKIFSAHVEKQHKGFKVNAVCQNPDGSYECEAELAPPAPRKPRQARTPKAAEGAPTALKKKA